MAKKFMGFKPETMTNKILPALGYNGPNDQKSINAFLAASPAAAAKMGKYTMAARQMVEGKVVNAYRGNYSAADAARDMSSMGIRNLAGDKASKPSTGFGSQAYKDLTAKTHAKAVAAQKNKRSTNSGSRSNAVRPAANQQASPVVRPPSNPAGNIPSAGATTVNPDGSVTPGSYTGATGTQMPSGSLLSKQIGDDPTKMVTRAGVVAADGGEAALIADGTGQAGAAAQAGISLAPQAATAEEIAAMTPAQYQAYESQQALQTALNNYLAAQGQLSPDSIVDPAQMNPFTAAALGLQAAQIAEPQTVDAPDPLEVTPDQLVSGSTVDQGRVDATIAKNQAASVKTELDTLMQDFQGGDPPSWAAGAMRNATAAMAARGLSASSMAGMEAALPIAQIDASNKQEMALRNAEQRASFLGMEFDQEFQAKVRNAARISEIANINFTAEQQIALENAKMAQTVDLANLDARQAKVLADAATLSAIDLANLDNRQQANVQNAKSFLQMDLTNLSNEQQMQVLRAQETSQSILSDAAAINAASQFNATSENQTNQFFAGLGSQVQRFNAEQINAINRFNSGETNAISQFNAAQTNARDQFNAQNHLIVAQANAAWAQAITTAANAAANQANRDAALVANNLTSTMYNNAIQRERDLLAWAWQSGESERDRITKLAEAQIDASGSSETLLETAAGGFVGELVTGAAAYIIGKYLPLPL